MTTVNCFSFHTCTTAGLFPGLTCEKVDGPTDLYLDLLIRFIHIIRFFKSTVVNNFLVFLRCHGRQMNSCLEINAAIHQIDTKFKLLGLVELKNIRYVVRICVKLGYYS